MYERCLAVVPFVGGGTWAGPKRPLYAPAAAQGNPASRSGILASDDGKLFLCEFVAEEPTALKPMLFSRPPNQELKWIYRENRPFSQCG